MSPKNSLKASINNNSDDLAHSPANEWVEIVEPKSKKRIYANLETGFCANHPPEGAVVSRSEDFSDHWWELYDQKTGKYYYYNPEQQKTAWTRPKELPNGGSNSSNTNGEGIKKKLLIIPVSKLQTFRKLTTNEQITEKCDASTQTIASNLVSIGTQTVSESTLENEFKDKLRFIDLSNESTSKSSSCTHSSYSTNRSHLNHRQLSDFNGMNRCSSGNRSKGNHVMSKESAENNQTRLEICHQQSELPQVESDINNRHNKQSSQHGLVKIHRGENRYLSYFGPPPSSFSTSTSNNSKKQQAPISIKSPSNKAYNQGRADDYSSMTSTFGNTAAKPPAPIGPHPRQHQQVTTNNLSHYLVREARAMGIALISDDEIDDEDQDSDDCIHDDDEDNDLNDDTSSHQGGALSSSNLNESQDLGEDSSEGWKSFSDQESSNNTAQKSNHHQTIQKSPIHCETTSSFTFNELLDDEKDPASCMSQQLDHRKLVENFKKSRQGSSFGLHDSLGRSYKLDANHAVQRIKTVADNYFNHDKDQLSNDRHLRQLSTLSTLPRPHKDKVALSKQEDSSGNLDADYDVVEENCGYYSDSEQLQQTSQMPSNSSFLDSSGGNVVMSSNNKSSSSSIKTGADQPHSPKSHFDRNKSSRGSTFSVESFARENLTRHPRKGGLLFNRKVKWSRMITWTKSSIKQPMISSVSSDLNADSISSFKLIQQFMGDRKVTINKKYRQILAQVRASSSGGSAGVEDHKDSSHKGGKSLGRSSSMNAGHNPNLGSNNSSNLPQLPDRLRDELAYELVVKGCSKSSLRDEIYIQMARQLTENPSQESICWGLILMSILLSYFSPSSKFSPFLLSFLEAHTHQMARDVCLPRLEKRLRQNWLTYCRKPADGEEISIVRLSITKWPQYCGVFGESLDRIMSLQTCSPYLKTLRLPWILTTLGDKLIETGGAETEGIFRCAADHDLIAQLRLEIDCVDFRKITDAKQVHSLLSNVQDPHVIAGLLKLFFRQLYEPVFPPQLYETCLQSGHDPQLSCRIFSDNLSNLNKDVVAYLIHLLQLLARPDRVSFTKMDNSNLSMVWAPNLLRSTQEVNSCEASNMVGSKWSIANGANGDDQQQPTSLAPSQSMIFEQTRQEMQFIRALIVHLDTSFIENVT